MGDSNWAGRNGVDGESGHQQTLRQEAANAMDTTWCPLIAADPGAGFE